MLHQSINKKQLEELIAFEPNTGCWIWTHGNLDKDGYGLYKHHKAHRISYITYEGIIPLKYHIHHKCKLKCCINPDHLEALHPSEHMVVDNYNGNKTHCKNGHEFTRANAYKGSNGYRDCRICRNLATQKWRNKKRGRAVSQTLPS